MTLQECFEQLLEDTPHRYSFNLGVSLWKHAPDIRLVEVRLWVIGPEIPAGESVRAGDLENLLANYRSTLLPKLLGTESEDADQVVATLGDVPEAGEEVSE